MAVIMRVEEKIDDTDIINVFIDYRQEDGLSWGKALNATSHILDISVDEVEEVLLKNKIYEKKDDKNDKDDQKSNKKNTLGQIMKKASSGKELTDEDKKILKAALNTAKSGESGDKEKADKIMKKVSDGKELTDEDKKFLSAIVDASKKSKKEHKNESIIKIEEEAIIPDTDIVLEKGDRIQVISKIKEDYGWGIQRGKEWDAFEDALEVFGAERLVEELARAMETDDLGDTLSFIFRNWEYESPYLE
jgi:hypothetical protein